MMADLVLCCFPGACSRATMIALEEAHVSYTNRVVNIRAGEQHRADYLALNPKAKVPALIVDGHVLTENVAILEYLANIFPDATLLPPPTDAFARAQALSAVTWMASTILPAGTRILRPERVCDVASAAERVATMAASEMRANLAIAESHMFGREWWVERWSVADAYLFYIVGLARARGVDPSAYSALLAHNDRVKARPATQRMLAWEESTMAQLQAA